MSVWICRGPWPRAPGDLWPCGLWRIINGRRWVYRCSACAKGHP